MRLLFVILFGVSLGACRHEPSSSVDQSVEIGRMPDPDKIVVAADEMIREEEANVLSIAKLYESFSGKRVIMRTENSKTKVSFSIKGPLTNTQAAKFLKLALLAEGFAMVPVPDEESIFRLISVSPIVCGGFFYTGSDTDEIPPFDDDEE